MPYTKELVQELIKNSSENLKLNKKTYFIVVLKNGIVRQGIISGFNKKNITIKNGINIHNIAINDIKTIATVVR